MENVKLVVAFAAGAAVGAYFMRKKLYSQMNEIIDAESEKAKEYYKIRSQYSSPATKEEEKKDILDEEAFIKEPVELREHKTDYTKFFKSSDAPPITNVRLEVNREPVPISKEEYDNAIQYYEKEILYFFTEDKVLATEDDEVLPIEITVGEGFERYFDEYEPDVAFVKNELGETVYEIIRQRKSFAKDVLGIEGGD